MFQSPTQNYTRLAAALILCLLVIRISSLVLSPVQLHGDEAQYWSWAQDLDWGYFSKPPLIAWIIASTTALLGDAEWAVRLSSPIIHAGTASILFLIGRFLFEARTGFWAVLLYYLMPAVFLSSGIVSTDVALLFCWSCALYGLVRLRENARFKWAILLGLGFGLGMMAKYAMLFFVPALIIAAIMDVKIRRGLLSRFGLLALVIAGTIFAPNIFWNAANDFATVSHTAANSNTSEGVSFEIGELLKFWTDQLGVFGPITWALYILAIIAAWRGKLSDNAKWLSLFVLSTLIIISVQALISRANANWVVTSYIGGSLLTAHYITTLWDKRLLPKIGVGLNAALGAIVIIAALAPSFADSIGMANALKRTRAWDQTVDAVKDAAAKGHNGKPYATIAVDNRLVFYDFTYYGMAQTAPLRIWKNTKYTDNHAEATAPLTSQSPEPILIVSYYAGYASKFKEDFGRLEPAGEINIDLGGGKTRELTLWAGYDYTPTQTREK